MKSSSSPISSGRQDRAAITVLLADDHLIVREGMRALIDANDGLQVIAEVGTGILAVTAAKTLSPDVIVMDIAMPVLGGLDATREILTFKPQAKILLLSAYLDDDYIERAIMIGAKGYLVKQTSSSLLADAIRVIQDGGRVFSPAVEARLQSSPQNFPGRVGQASRKIASLTAREIEVVRLIADGKTNQRVAKALAISTKTVEKHRQNAMDKLNIHDTAGLTRYATAQRLIESDREQVASE